MAMLALEIILIDAIYNMTGEQLEAMAKYEKR